MSISKAIRRALLADNPISRLAMMGYRATIPPRYYLQQLAVIPRWIVTSREITNFTYDLTELNRGYLANTVSAVTGIDLAQIESYISEPERDAELMAHITALTKASTRRTISDGTPLFGRRLGWYAFVRATKPKVVIETGIDKGLGSVLLCSALLRNKAEGFDGSYYGTDINLEAGFLLAGKWGETGRILYGDSIESLRKISEPIDLFINDSDHSAEYELAEYRTVANNLSANAIVLGDNSHSSKSLWIFARETGRKFLFFADQPLKHWYPGAGIGICFRDRRS